MGLHKHIFTLLLASTLVLSSIHAQRSAKVFEPVSPSATEMPRDQDLQQSLGTVPRNLDYTVVLSIPLGGNGIHYETQNGSESESETWGPASLRIAPDGTFLIIDTVANEVLRYTSEGAQMESVVVVGASAIRKCGSSAQAAPLRAVKLVP